METAEQALLFFRVWGCYCCGSATHTLSKFWRDYRPVELGLDVVPSP